MENGTKSFLRVSILAVAFLLLLSAFFDNGILRWVSIMRNPVINSVMAFVASIKRSYILIIVGIVLLARKQLLKPWLAVYLASSAAVFLIKEIIKRPRPLDNLIAPLIEADGFSFPSGHATVIFSALPLLVVAFPRLKFLTIALCFIFILARVYVGVHYPSDIFSGALLGMLTSIATMKVLRTKLSIDEPR